MDRYLQMWPIRKSTSSACAIAGLCLLVGIGLGIAVAEVIGMRFAMPVDLKPLSILGAVSASIVVGIVSGIIPARRAASLDPVEALR